MAALLLGAGASSFVASSSVAAPGRRAQPAARAPVVSVEAKRVCQLTGKKRNKANVVTFSNKHNRKWQEPNLQHKKVYWEAGKRWVKLRICTKAIKTIEKNGLDAMAAEAGIDLWKLPFEDARPERLAYLAEHKGAVPVAANPRAIRNQARIASSSKRPRVPVYEPGGRIVWVKPGQEELYRGGGGSAAGAAAAEAAAAAAAAAEQQAPKELKITVQE